MLLKNLFAFIWNLRCYYEEWDFKFWCIVKAPKSSIFLKFDLVMSLEWACVADLEKKIVPQNFFFFNLK